MNSTSSNADAAPAVRWLTVGAEYVGQRLDNYLLRELKGLPRTRLYRALRKGEVRVNKGRVKADYRLCEGDSVRVPPLRLAERDAPQQVPRRWQNLLRQRTLYEDAGLLVINKPSGLAVHGGSGVSMGLIECLRLLRPDDHYLELVHRLDRDTSGCLLLARKAAVLRELHRQLRADLVGKSYRALVAGRWPRQRRFVEAPLLKNSVKSGERIVRVDVAGKQARTEFAVLQRFSDCTLVEARPITGRTHQIRVHAQHAGHPLLGDEKYGERGPNQWARELGLKRLFLHAARLSFLDMEGKRKQLSAELDKDLEEFLKKVST